MQTYDRLVDAVIQQESNFDPAAVSRCGAKGLMQLMDSTGQEWHDRLKVAEPYDPFDPKQNRKIGTAYLVHLLGVFGTPELALAAYNAGAGATERICKQRQSRVWAAVKARFPRETQDYVTKIMQHWTGKSIA